MDRLHLPFLSSSSSFSGNDTSSVLRRPDLAPGAAWIQRSASATPSDTTPCSCSHGARGRRIDAAQILTHRVDVERVPHVDGEMLIVEDLLHLVDALQPRVRIDLGLDAFQRFLDRRMVEAVRVACRGIRLTITNLVRREVPRQGTGPVKRAGLETRAHPIVGARGPDPVFDTGAEEPESTVIRSPRLRPSSMNRPVPIRLCAQSLEPGSSAASRWCLGIMGFESTISTQLTYCPRTGRWSWCEPAEGSGRSTPVAGIHAENTGVIEKVLLSRCRPPASAAEDDAAESGAPGHHRFREARFALVDERIGRRTLSPLSLPDLRRLRLPAIGPVDIAGAAARTADDIAETARRKLMPRTHPCNPLHTLSAQAYLPGGAAHRGAAAPDMAIS